MRFFYLRRFFTLGNGTFSLAVDESTQKRMRFMHVTATFLHSLRSRLVAPRLVMWCVCVCVHRNSLRCLFVLRFGEPEETRGVTNVAHYSETTQRVPTQFPRFQITFRCLFPFALKFATLRQRSPVCSSCCTVARVYVCMCL